ncbi:hypothetical protein SMD22_25800 [Brevibacillus halotolerans]|nr:hypothetical protein SMD22_25800 [Brevibacillus halotolerans]
MHSKVLWSIDNEIDPKNFERMCAEIFFHEGYKNIIPLGGNYDNGRDAQQTFYDENNRMKIIFFQFTLESSWEKKLKRELVKLEEKQHVFHKYIFVTSQRVTGSRMDYYKKHIFQKYGWEFNLFEREWLRLMLEEKYPQLASKYLHIEIDNEKKKEGRDTPNFDIGDSRNDDKKKIISEIFMIENHYGKTELFKRLTEFDDIDLSKTRVLINELLLDFYDINNALGTAGITNIKGFGLDSHATEIPKRLVLSFGMGVPIRLLQKIISILSSYQLEYFDFVDYRQEVYDEYLYTVEIGTYSYNDTNLGLIKVDNELVGKLLDHNISANEFYALLIQDVFDPCNDW